MSVRYTTLRRDFEYLDELIRVEDSMPIYYTMIKLLQNPTKKEAGDIYERWVSIWFSERSRSARNNTSLSAKTSMEVLNDVSVILIAERHNIDIEQIKSEVTDWITSGGN